MGLIVRGAAWWVPGAGARDRVPTSTVASRVSMARSSRELCRLRSTSTIRTIDVGSRTLEHG